MAIACFCGLPDFISALMLAETIFLLEPFFIGIEPPIGFLMIPQTMKRVNLAMKMKTI
jgi:hypothetical protein